MGSKRKLSIFLIVTIVIIVIAALLYYSGLLLPTTLKTGSFDTAIVDRGQVISTIQATGIIESENEVLLLSPATSIIKSILKEPGNRVKEGEILLQLDTEAVQNDIERLKDQLEVKRINLDKTQLNAQSTKLDLDYNEEVKKLRITSLQSQLTDEEQLLEVGGISPARLEKTKQEITLAEKDLKMLIEKNSIRLKQLTTDERALLLQIRIDEKVLEDKVELLSKMDVKAPSAGIILNISGQVGEKVGADKMLVRMSDLSSFKLTGSIDEKFANQIKTGKLVYVTVDNEQLDGLIGNITPMVENNKIQFNVHLKEKNHPKLIANQQLQIHFINHNKENVLRIQKLPEFESKEKQFVFVVKGDKAVKKEITIGINGDNYCEVLSGLEEGEEIISESMNAFRQLNEIEIKH